MLGLLKYKFCALALFISWLIFLMGCGSSVTQWRKEGFNLTARSFAMVPDNKQLYKKIEIKSITVYIVGSPELYSYGPYKTAATGVAGYANTNNEIWIIGKTAPDGSIIVNQTVLGHELAHLLGFKDPEVRNPDTLDHIGF